MPEYFEPQIEGVSEAALQERIKLRKVKASVDMFDQLLQAGDLSSFKAPGNVDLKVGHSHVYDPCIVMSTSYECNYSYSAQWSCLYF